MTSNVVSLAPNLALAENLDEVANRLERVASELRRGVYPDTQRAVILLTGPLGCYVRAYGPPLTCLELVGLLDFARHDVITGNELQPAEG